MFFIVGYLYRATTVSLVDGIDHGDRLLASMRIHHDTTVRVASRTTDDLEEGGLGSEESDFLGIEYPDEARLWEVETFSEEVNSDNNIYLTEAIISEYFQSFYSFYFGV